MIEKILKTRIIQKHDTEANWLEVNDFIPLQGEIIIYDIDNNNTSERIKIGDGVTAVNELPFINGVPTSEKAHQALVTDANGNITWDDRPIYSMYVEQTILPETALTFNADLEGFVLTEPLSLEIGKTYTVNWNGVLYESECRSVTAQGSTATVLGDISTLVGDTSTGEPYGIVLAPPEQVEAMGGIYAMIMALDGSETITLSIAFNGEVTKKLDMKYLPDGYPNEEIGLIEILPETSFVGEGTEWMTTEPLRGNIEAGKTYVVNYNGAPYTCVCSLLEGVMPCLGNTAAMDGTGDTGEPFVFVVVPDALKEQADGTTAMVMPLDEASEVIVSVSGEGKTITKIDMKYLPDGLPYVQAEDEIILAENTYTPLPDDPTWFPVSAIPTLTVGTTYRVRWNGTDYDVVARSGDNFIDGAIVLGNGSKIGFGDAIDRDKPFGFASHTGFIQYVGTPSLFVSYDGSETATASIFIPAGTVYKLGEEFLPDSVATKEYVDEAIAGIEIPEVNYPVNSVNGKTGEVVLTAADVKALPDTTIIPSIEGLATKEYVDNTVKEQIIELNSDDGITYKATIPGLSSLGVGFKFLGLIKKQSNSTQLYLSINDGEAKQLNCWIINSDNTSHTNQLFPSPDSLLGGNIYTFYFTVNGWIITEFSSVFNKIPYNLRNASRAVGSVRMISSKEENDTYGMGAYSFAIGSMTQASGGASFAEGNGSSATGHSSHAEGISTIASGQASHAEGYNTTAKGEYQHVQGKYNITDNDNKYAHIVGNGYLDTNTLKFSNAHTLDWDGNAWYQGNVYVGGTSQDEGVRLLTENDIEYVTDEEVFAFLVESDLMMTVTDADGAVLIDENDNILQW